VAVAALLICTRRRALLAFKAAIIALVAMILGACSKSPTPYIWNLPHNIPPPPVPADNPVIGFLRGEKTDISLMNEFVQVLKNIMEKELVYPENKRPFEITYFQKQVFKQPKMKLSIENFIDWNSSNSNIKIIKK